MRETALETMAALNCAAKFRGDNIGLGNTSRFLAPFACDEGGVIWQNAILLSCWLNNDLHAGVSLAQPASHLSNLPCGASE